MANGIINLPSTNSKLEGRIVWSSTSNGSVNNTSNVHASIQVRRNDGYVTKGTWSGELTIAGNKQTFNNPSTSVGIDWVTMKEFTVNNIAHNNDGTGSCWLSGWCNAPSGTSLEDQYVDGGETVTLDKIPRYLSITKFEVASKTLNSAVISWATSNPRSSTHYSLNGGSWTGSSTHGENIASDQKSGTFNIKGLSPNTTYKLKIKCIRTDSGLTTESNEISFATYDIAKISTLNNFDHGNSETVKITNPANISNLKLVMKIGDTQILSRTVKTGDNTISFSDTELDNLYKKYGNGSRLTATFSVSGSGYTNSKTCTVTFKGNQKTVKTNINNLWKRGKIWANINGVWKRAVLWTNINGTWRRGI